MASYPMERVCFACYCYTNIALTGLSTLLAVVRGSGVRDLGLLFAPLSHDSHDHLRCCHDITDEVMQLPSTWQNGVDCIRIGTLDVSRCVVDLSEYAAE
jgi:hypothetical protein